MPSFDIVVTTDLQEVDNAINQASKEIGQRYDFRGSKSRIEWDKKEEIVLLADDDYKLQAVTDVLKAKLVRRSVAVKNLIYGQVEPAAGGLVRQKIEIQQGIPVEKAKELVKKIKQSKLRVQAQIQESQVRVSGKKRDDLQQIIQLAKETDLGLELQFVNFRD